MQILEPSLSDTPGSHRVLMFGMGMLGGSIRAKLIDLGYAVSGEVGFPWNEATKWGESLSAIDRLWPTGSISTQRISVVWAAGEAGFNCAKDAARKEIASFDAVIGFLVSLRARLKLSNTDIHFISSAGGLFEGQRVVDPNSVPSAIRPYGQLKLTQEKTLLNTFGTNEVSIYRPSSVYGPMAQKTHQGLINNLINDGLRGRESVLDAHIMSLRDYVYSGDVGAFVGHRVRAGTAGSKALFLVTSRPTSIFEVVRTVQRILRLKLRFRYDDHFGNHRDITFSSDVQPAGWSPSPLDVGIRRFMIGIHSNRLAPRSFSHHSSH